MLDVANRNFAGVMDLMKTPEENVDLAIELFQNVRVPDARDEYFAQLDQQLHNYLASAAALVDHSRRLVDKYAGSDFAMDYERRKNAVISQPVADFIRCLRNYMLHYQLPFVGHTVEFDETGTCVTFELSTATLREFDNWTRQSPSYIEQAGDAVDLRA